MFSGSGVTWAVLCLALLVSGCGDDEPEGGDPPTPPSSSASESADPTAPPSPTRSAATGPVLSLKGVSLHLPQGWQISNDDSNILVVGADQDGDAVINLSSFPSLDRGASLGELARATVRTGGYPPGSVQEPVTMAGRSAFHVAGAVMGDDSEEFGLINRGDIVSVEFVFISDPPPRAERQELIDSVLASVVLP